MSTIWKRRIALMAVVALVVAVPVTLIVRDRDEGSGSPAADAPELRSTKLYRDLGVKLALPRGWREKRGEGVLGLRRTDGGARIAISSPGPAGDADRLHDETVAELRGSYRDFDVLRRIDRTEVGGLRGRATAIAAAARKGGAPVRLLVSTARGKKRAYLLVIVVSGSDRGRSLVEAQAIVNELKLVG